MTHIDEFLVTFLLSFFFFFFFFRKIKFVYTQLFFLKIM